MESKIPYWRLSSFYFFYFATLGGFLPYWSLYLENIGFNPMEIGELTALLVGTKIVAPNLWGWIADYSGKSLSIIRIASLLAACIFSGFLFDHGFRWFAWVTIAFSFFWNAALPQFEAATLFHLRHDSHRYSQIRLWGSVGFIVAVLGVGHLLDLTHITILPVIIIALLLTIWWVSLITPEVQTTILHSEQFGVFTIIRQPEVLAFLLVYMLVQAAHGPYYVFYSIYLTQFNYSGTTIGFLWALGVAAEVLLFIFMRRILQRYTLRNILLFSIFVSICRWLLIAWGVKHILVLLLAQLLHAATFGSSHVVAIHLVHQYFGSSHQGKGQALYSSIGFGLGGMLGSLYSGYFWDSIGSQQVFSFAALISCAAFAIAFVWVGKTQKSKVLR